MQTRQTTAKLGSIRRGNNPRTFYDPVRLERLQREIAPPIGIIQPVVVQTGPDGALVLRAGEYRCRAAELKYGPDYDMPISVRDDLSEQEIQALAVIENVGRADMCAADQALAARNLMQSLSGDRQEAARLLGWEPQLLSARLRLTACTPAVLAAQAEGRIKLGHAELLSGLAPDTQDKVLEGVIDNKVPVAVLRDQLASYARQLSAAIFDTAQCANCPHNSTPQAELFDSHIGGGFCQHPTHYEELTRQAVEVVADRLRENYPVIRIIEASDGFVPLPVSADGEGAVGAVQYDACRGCASFGAAVSNLPGSHGSVTESLCFDAKCNAEKRRLHAPAPGKGKDGTAPAQGKGAAAAHAGKKAGAASATPTRRVLEYRVACWRLWLARWLMAPEQSDSNARVLVALALSGSIGQLDRGRYGKALAGATGGDQPGFCDLPESLQLAGALDEKALAGMGRAVAGAVAFGIDEPGLLTLLNHVQLDEADWFTLDEDFLTLLTKSELAALAAETGLKKKLGKRFTELAEGKRDAFVQALLAAAATGALARVPSMLRYPRKDVPPLAGPAVPAAALSGAVEQAGTAGESGAATAGGAVPGADNGAGQESEPAPAVLEGDPAADGGVVVAV